MDMKTSLLTRPFFLVALLFAMTPLYAFGSMTGPTYGNQPDNGTSQQQGWVCPALIDRGMGAGMKESGNGSGYGYQTMQPQPEPLEKAQARQRVEDYLKSTRNPNLKLGTIKDKGQYFEARIVAGNDDSLVDIIIVDKNTACLRSML